MVANLSHLPPLGNSDHVCIQFNVLCYSEYKNSDKTRYNIAAANIDMMKESLSSVDWSSILDPLNTNDAWLLFKTTFQDIIDKHVPTYIPKERKNLYATPEVFILKKKKNKLWKKYCLTHSPSDFTSANNELRSLTCNLRKNYEQHLVQNVKSKPKAFWQYINSRLKIRPSTSELLSPSGSTVCSDFEMAALFNDYFSSVFTVEDTSVVPTAPTPS